MYRFRSDGTLLGVTREAGDGYSGETCAFDPSGNIYLVRGGHWLTKKAADGRTLWQTRAFPDAGGGSSIYAIRASASGVVLAGTHPIESETAFVARVRADGSVAWTRAVTGISGITRVAFGPDERVVATGDIRNVVDFGTGPIQSPAGAQDVTLLLQLGGDGAVQRHRFIDISIPSDVMVQPDGSIYLLLGDTRTGSFGAAGAPGNVVSGATVAKLAPTGEFVFSRKLSPPIERELAAANLVPYFDPGTRPPGLYGGSLASGPSGVFVAGAARLPDECGPNRSSCDVYRGFTALYAP
jgi:outer membrane protein assembly factor BamB